MTNSHNEKKSSITFKWLKINNSLLNGRNQKFKWLKIFDNNSSIGEKSKVVK